MSWKVKHEGPIGDCHMEGESGFFLSHYHTVAVDQSDR